MTDGIADTSLRQQIDQFEKQVRQHVPPEIAETLSRELETLARSAIAEGSLPIGSRAPAFTLTDQAGRAVDLADLLTRGPAVVTFYRGTWCPYCNLQLRAYQTILPEIERRGATLVAISPQTPDFSASTAADKGLRFPVLSDVGNQVARRYGLVFTLSEALQDLQKKFGNEVPRFNGDASWELPMPGTFVVSRAGMVRLAFVDPDYRRRLEPAAILERLSDLR